MKILLVDDHILFREGLASLLEIQPDLTVVGSTNSVHDAITHTNELCPELVLMDFNLPDGDGLDYTREILDQHPHIKVVFLTMIANDMHMLEAVDNGAVGHLRKNVPVKDLLSFIYSLKHGETTIYHSNRDS
jgi:DNA-binding NarL/FixJ family response regulator